MKNPSHEPFHILIENILSLEVANHIHLTAEHVQPE